MSEAQQWYILKQEDGSCQINNFCAKPASPAESWGPFATYEDAIAKRVGLIRSGKCQPQ